MPDPFPPRESSETRGFEPAAYDGAETVPDGDGNGPDVELYGGSRFEEQRRTPGFGPGLDQPTGGVEPVEYRPIWVPVVAPRRRNRIWLHALLFGLTIVTTTLAGIGHWLSFVSDFGTRLAIASPAQLLAFYTHHWSTGLWYSSTILIILGAHELGHYFACRYYRVDASLPYFLPVPIVETGTLGAFIRIRQPITTKRMLFDIGIAGPLAGFVFAVPALFIGIALSGMSRVPVDFSGFELGEPLLFRIATYLIWGRVPAGFSLNLHPMAFAAWFGLLATALNLFPIGQLDGGHISYAVLKRHSTNLTYLTLGGLLVLNVVLAVVYQTPALLLFTVLIVVMLAIFGPRHPPVMDEHLPIDRTRVILAVVALVIFILCFTPVPIREV